MHFKGLGTDIIEVERIKQSIERHGESFLNKVFTAIEQEYCQRYKAPEIRYAGRFAAKEAVMKALGAEGISWQDVEVVNDESGRPHVQLSEELAKRHDNPEIHLSLSHTENYATATAVAITRGSHG